MKDITAEELFNQLPLIFFPAMAGEIVSIYGHDFYDDTSNCYWVVALKSACEKIKSKWIYKKYKSLPWDVANEFDWLVSNRLHAIKPEDCLAYYRFKE